ncbi:PP2C family protein-serine/threonine phosphatase [Streptomyces sp. 8L]|uniref:PP2C family protein-serine/threonine phosphatase n=1 Tax=Streptomyces sp. 8L TaxID=2877242 RepID=UPI001CD764BD|nr:PP2C family protein-serine/threonine phosphatase [Streptomyces sp. 8L]MCA1218657.1 serine/threonine-protein phosphatase [Streptomyces sp. 8L]
MPGVVIVVAVLADLYTPVASASLLAVAPVAAVTTLGPWAVTAVGLVAMAVHAVLADVEGTFGWQRGLANQIALAAVTALAVTLNRALRAQHTTTRHARHTAAVAQKAVLPTPPEHLGALHIAARYTPADQEALIGGDLYVVQRTPYGVRAMIGDVRGKGLDAVSAVSVDIGAFRFAADQTAELSALAQALDEALLREGLRRHGEEESEGFTTALLAEFSPDLGEVRIVNRGHPAPVLLNEDGRARALVPSREAPPLGMMSLGRWDAPVDVFAFPPGSTLVLLTDGCTEARNREGVFYDPGSRLEYLWSRQRGSTGGVPTPGTLLDLLLHDVTRYTRGRVHDDQALLALHHRPGR